MIDFNACIMPKELNETFGRKLKYKFSISVNSGAPIVDNGFETSKIQVKFLPHFNTIKIEVRNISDETIILNWENSSIYINQIASPIRYLKDTITIDNALRQSETIPPGGVIDDWIIPEANLQPGRKHKLMEIIDFYPRTLDAPIFKDISPIDMLGQQLFSLKLVFLDKKNQSGNYLIDFKVRELDRYL